MATNRSRKQVRESALLGLALTPTSFATEKRPYFWPRWHGRTAARTPTTPFRLKEKQRLRALSTASVSRSCAAAPSKRPVAPPG